MRLTWKMIQLFLLALWLAANDPQQSLAAGEPKPAEPIPFADGAIDPSLRTVFVSSPKGGIQAIRLEDGNVIWTNDDCQAQPWLVAGTRLIARGERISVLDLKSGKVQIQCDAPAYPKVAVPDRCTVSFNLWAPRVVGDTLETQWFGVANIDRGKGRPFNFQGWTAFNKEAPSGTARFNLTTGKVTLQPDAKSADVSQGLVPEASKPERRLPPGLSEKLTAVWQKYHKDHDGRVLVQGERMIGVAMTLEKAGNEYNKKISLQAWDVKTGAELPGPVELIKDKALNIANIVITEDRRHVAVGFSNSALTIYSLTDGKMVARDIKGVSNPARAFVDGKRLYYTQLAGGRGAQTPNELNALDLESHKVVWQRSLKPRSTIPLPP
jgi:hypothetical protein